MKDLLKTVVLFLMIYSCQNQNSDVVNYQFWEKVRNDTESENIVVSKHLLGEEKVFSIEFINSKYKPSQYDIEYISDSLLFVFSRNIRIDSTVEKYIFTFFYDKESLNVEYPLSEVYSTIGMNYYKNKEYSEALNLMNKALKLDSNNSILHFNKAVVLFNLKKYEQSISSIESSVSLNGHNRGTLVLLAKIYKELDNYEKNKTVIEKLSKDFDFVISDDLVVKK